MRRTSLLSLLALSLLAAPATSALDAPVAVSTSAAQAGSSEVLSRTTATSTTRLVAPRRTTKPVRRPGGKLSPVVRPVATPVAAPVAAPTAAPAAPEPTTPVVQAPAKAGAYAFLHVDAGAPVRWNPCADVPWTFNPAGAPAGGLAAVQAAVAELSRRTGLTFAYQGTSTEPVAGAYLKQAWQQFRPLHVGWTSSAESDMLAGRPVTTVGMARVLWTGSYDSTGANRTQIASGVIAFNSASKAPTTGAGSWYTYALHELGHAVGLSHVEDATQVMNAVISGSVGGYGNGDLAGLGQIGRGAGCLPEIR